MMLTTGKTLKYLTEWKARMPFGLAGMPLSFLFFVTMFFLIPAQMTFGQGLLRRSSNDDRQNTESSQNKQDSANFSWNSLDERSKKLIREVTNNKTFLRQMPQQIGHCDPEMYDYMVSHPDVVVELWELLGVTQISLTETGPNKYLLKEGTATTSQIEVLFKSKNLCIVYAAGEYEAPVLRRKIKGDVILLLKSRYGRDKEYRPVVQCDLDAYVRIHNPGAEMLAKILIPVVGKIADSNFEQTAGFVMNVSEAAQEDFEPLQELSQRMKNVRPEVAEEFALVAEDVFDRDVDRCIAQAGATQRSIAELAQPPIPPASESLPMPKYALQADQVTKPQEQAFAANDSRWVAPVAPNDLGDRLTPMMANEMRRGVPQNQLNTTAAPAVRSNESTEMSDSEISSLPPRRLTMTNDGRSINQGAADDTNDQTSNTGQQRVNHPTMAPAPAFGNPIPKSPNPKNNTSPVHNDLVRGAAPSPNEIISRNASRWNGTAPSLEIRTDADRVMIGTIAPSPLSVVARPNVQPSAPIPATAGQTALTQSGSTANSQNPDRLLPLPMYLP